MDIRPQSFAPAVQTWCLRTGAWSSRGRDQCKCADAGSRRDSGNSCTNNRRNPDDARRGPNRDPDRHRPHDAGRAHRSGPRRADCSDPGRRNHYNYDKPTG